MSINHETAERVDVKETQVSVPLGGGTFAFSVFLPRYIHEKLTREDWQQAGASLRTHANDVVRRMVMHGTYFAPGGLEAAKQSIEQGMKDILHRLFVERQKEAGDLEWAVPSLLKGERYA